jgi:hypothetical protein
VSRGGQSALPPHLLRRLDPSSWKGKPERINTSIGESGSCATTCDTRHHMGAVNLRVDAGTAAFLERVARQTGRTKSEVVREALEALRKGEARPPTAPPAQTMAHLIGCWDSGGMKLSERTGERFARLLRQRKNDHRIGGRRPARRAD